MATPTARPPPPPTFRLTLVAEPSSLKDSVKGLLHTIFFHRLFPALRPLTRDVAIPAGRPSSSRSPSYTPRSGTTHAPHEPSTVTLPLIDDADLESTLSDRVTQLSRLLLPSGSRTADSDAAATLHVHFYERRRKKAASGFSSFWSGPAAGSTASSENVRWESWTLEVKVVDDADEGVRAALASLKEAALEVLRVVGEEKEHIPPITDAKENPFPWEVVVVGRQD